MVEELDGEHQAGYRPETKMSMMMLMIWEKHEPAVDPSGGVLALAPPLALLQLPLPHQLALSADQPGGLVQREEDVVAGVRVRQEGGEVELLAEHFEHEGNGVGEEVGEGEGELDGEILATDRQEGVLRVAARMNQRIVGNLISKLPASCVNPVELICRRAELKLFQDELEAPGVRYEAQKVRW